MFGDRASHRFQVKWDGVYGDGARDKPISINPDSFSDSALDDAGYYQSAYMCPSCEPKKRFMRQPLYPMLFKLQVGRTSTQCDGDDYVVGSLFTCPKCHRFFANVHEINGQDLKDVQLLRTGQWTYPALKEMALISEPYAADEWRSIVGRSKELSIDPTKQQVVVAAKNSPVDDATTQPVTEVPFGSYGTADSPAESEPASMAAIISNLVATEYSDFRRVSIADAESTVRMLVHEVYGVYERQSSAYAYLTREEPSRVGGYELNSRGEESGDVLEEEVPQVIQTARNYLLLRATMENDTQEGLKAIERGADPNVACIYKGTRSFPIIEAALKGNARLVRALIEVGADVNIKKDNGEFALLDAAGYEHLEAAEALLANGANPNAIARGLTPLTQAESVEMINLLLKYGADPNIPDGDGDLPIVTRITNRDKRGTIVLRDAGSDPNHRNRSGKSADDFCQRYFFCKLADL